MKGLTIYLGFVGVFFLVVGLPHSEAIYNNICRLFPDGTKLRDPRSCLSYVTCINSTEVSTKCPKNQIFSVDSKKCVKSDTDGCEDPCEPEDDDYWIADPNTCNGYYYCTNGTGLLGICSEGQHFSEALQECIYAEKSKCKGDKYCEIVPNGINFKDENNCERYQVCTRGKLKSKKCPKKQWFDRETGKCTAKAAVKGCDILPQKICMRSIFVERNKYVRDKATCRGYYFCADKGKVADDNPQWFQCKEGLFFDYNHQSCTDPLNVDCDEDRCDGRGDIFVNSDSDCQHYLVCKDGKTEAERKCADELFFDEKRQGCTSEVIEYGICT